jgi:hypothetical protein
MTGNRLFVGFCAFFCARKYCYFPRKRRTRTKMPNRPMLPPRHPLQPQLPKKNLPSRIYDRTSGPTGKNAKKYHAAVLRRWSYDVRPRGRSSQAKKNVGTFLDGAAKPEAPGAWRRSGNCSLIRSSAVATRVSREFPAFSTFDDSLASHLTVRIRASSEPRPPSRTQALVKSEHPRLL